MPCTTLVWAFLLVSIGFVYSQKPWEPAPNPEEWWIARHNELVANTQQNGTQIKILCMGSSLMEFWANEGSELWNSKYAPLNAVNYGIRGDRTEQVLWRINNGEIDGLNPDLVVLFIGSNNVPAYSNNTEVVIGINTVIDTFRSKLPNTPLLYVTIFPRGDRSPVNATFERILSINEDVYQANHNPGRVNVLNIFWDFAVSMGQLKDELYLTDLLHFTPAGYAQWDSSMNSTFYELLNQNRTS